MNQPLICFVKKDLEYYKTMMNGYSSLYFRYTWRSKFHDFMKEDMEKYPLSMQEQIAYGHYEQDTLYGLAIRLGNDNSHSEETNKKILSFFLDRVNNFIEKDDAQKIITKLNKSKKAKEPYKSLLIDELKKIY